MKEDGRPINFIVCGRVREDEVSIEKRRVNIHGHSPSRKERMKIKHIHRQLKFSEYGKTTRLPSVGIKSFSYFESLVSRDEVSFLDELRAISMN